MICFFDGIREMSEKDQQDLILDFQTIFEESFDTIYVADGEGRTLRVSASAESIFGCKPEELIGRSIYELEKAGVFRPSSTRLAIEKKKKIHTFQQTATGRQLFVITIPCFDGKGRITRVISISKDITETVMLEQELTNTRRKLQEYYRESGVKGEEERENIPLVYCSRKMEEICQCVRKAAEFDSTVLLMGESGVGKEILSQMIHDFSPRVKEPFVKLNCGAIPENLLESELFGYERGAFTGAFKSKPGLFELADRGTLFLDEIGEMPPPLQSKILRVIQEKECGRIGGTKPVVLNVRIIAATNRNLEEMVRDGSFRKDLYYRLNVLPVTVPPLRDRPEDIVPLCRYFLTRLNRKFGCDKQISKEAMDALVAYGWPGNVRELENLIERLLITTTGDVVRASDLPEFIRAGALRPYDELKMEEIPPLRQTLAMVEEKLIELALRKYHTTTAAAKALGVSQSTISRKRVRGGGSV